MEIKEGITIEKDQNGEDAFVRIDLKKYGHLIKPFLDEIQQDDFDFEKEWERSISKEELAFRINKHIDSLPWEK